MITRALPPWFFVIAVILVLQTVSASLGRLVPVAGPAFTAEFGWDESWVGYLTAANIVGALFALTVGIGIMRRLGGVRALQWSLLIGAAALLLYLIPSIALALVASACVGLANGTANPAGSEVLTRLTPPAHRNLVFSIKQAGVPLGGVLGGLAIPPLVEAMGWRLAAVVVAAVCMAATLLTWPFQSRIDLPREQRLQYRLDSFRLTDILVPLRSLAHGNRLWRASWVGVAGDPASRLGHVRSDVSCRGAGPVAQHRRARVRGDADDQHARPRHAWMDRRPCRIQHHDIGDWLPGLGGFDHPARPQHIRLAAVEFCCPCRLCRDRGVRLERRSDRRGGAAFAA